jgi:phosphatidylinositol alpha-mannosyltransferase
MRIAIVTQSYYPRPGGVTEHVHHTALELRKRGHSTYIVTANFGTDPHADPDVIRLGRNVLIPHHGAWSNVTVGLKLGSKLKNVFEEMDPDIIHTHCPLVPTLPLQAIHAAPHRAAVVGTFHAAAERCPGYRLFNPALKYFADRIDTRIAVSDAARRLAEAYFPGRYTIVPNGIDCRRFSPRNQPFERFKDGAFNILFVGRMDRRKGLKYLIHGVSLAAQAARRRLRLIIVGENGARRHLLPKASKKVELHFAGMVSRDILPRFYASGDVFCSPAVDKESFGIVLLEAMASGVPVIGTGIPGYLTLLDHNRNALVVPPRDPDALSDAILELLRDDLKRQKLRQNGCEYARRYDWQLVAARLEQVYQETLSGRRHERTVENDLESINISV